MFAGDYYKHKKGGYYERYFEVATHSEDLSPMIIYRSVKVNPNDEKTWVRPASMWDEVDENGVARFTPVTEDDFVTLSYYNFRCPVCAHDPSFGAKYFSKLDLVADISFRFCEFCGYESLSFDKIEWAYEKTEDLIKPLAERALRMVK